MILDEIVGRQIGNLHAANWTEFEAGTHKVFGPGYFIGVRINCAWFVPYKINGFHQDFFVNNKTQAEFAVRYIRSKLQHRL